MPDRSAHVTAQPAAPQGSAAPVVALLGLGEAGAAIASDLAVLHVRTRGWDPAAGAPDAGVAIERVDSACAAVEGSDVVLSVNSAAAALPALQEVLPALRAGQVFADLNSAGAALKRELAELAAPSGALFADVALMAPVPGRGIRTPALASGPGAERLAAWLRPLGMPIELLGGNAGEAAARKLLRSVFMKGLAAACLESVEGAHALGCEAWMREQIAETLDGADGALLERLLSGSVTHAARRVHEVHDAAEQLRELGVAPRVCEASRGWLEELRDRG
jgi:3-hydroxyisobutyrate dehydrogenase-like beta-hydroxyacid dehydrogenase